MISIEQISGEIAALEEEKPTHVTMQKLANLYTVRDHMIIDSQPAIPTTVVSEVIVPVSDSDFMKLIDGMHTKRVLPVIDELMSTLQIIDPRLYNSVIRKIEDSI